MLKKLLLNLQLFAEGGDGGDGGSAAPTGDNGIDTSGEKIPASIPEKAKKYFQKAMEKTNANKPKSAPIDSDPVQTTNEPNPTTEKIPYADLIKSDDYKEEHKAYMDKTISDRLKKYKGIEETSGKQKAILDVVASKYGVNPNDENFLEVLQQKIDDDDSYVEDYAMEHDMTNDEARRILNMERKVAQIDAEKAAIEAERAEMAKQEEIRKQIMLLRQNAEKTKSQFPEFDLDIEIKDERFRKLCAVNNGDTTAAYMACHWNEILPATVQRASRQIQAQTAQAVASNKARPIENGLSSSAPSVVEQDFSKMSLKELRQFASEQRRKKAGR